ncbi:MAG: glutathione transferase GstA [Pseudomonadota bacterium]
MRLFYKPGACSLASHIVLHQLGIPFDIERVDTAKGRTETGRTFRDISANGYVPALELTSGDVLTEGAAILQYLADQHPEQRLVPTAGTLSRARVQEHLNFISSELHKAFSPLFSTQATDGDKARAVENVARRLDYIETILGDGRNYLVEDRFSVADAYLFVVCNWANVVGIDLAAWPHVQAFVARIAALPSAQAAMKAEGLIR